MGKEEKSRSHRNMQSNESVGEEQFKEGGHGHRAWKKMKKGNVKNAKKRSHEMVVAPGGLGNTQGSETDPGK